jgi:hypothetical protein
VKEREVDLSISSGALRENHDGRAARIVFRSGSAK